MFSVALYSKHVLLRWLHVACLLLLLAPAARAAAIGDDLRRLGAEVQTMAARQYAGDATVMADLRGAAERLTRLIQEGNLRGSALIFAHRLRGEAVYHENSARRARGEPIDQAAARQALADLGLVIGAGGPPNLVANVEYMTASLAYMFLADAELAYLFWERCARADHAGCMNVVAGQRMDAGRPEDIREALDLYRRIFDTGTKFQCAGAFSAMSIASIGHFLDVRLANEDASVWIGRAYVLLDELAARQFAKNPCNRDVLELMDFLHGLSRGVREESLLHAARGRAETPLHRAIADYFLAVPNDPIADPLLALPDAKSGGCSLHFLMLWHAVLNRDRARAGRHHQALAGTGGGCRVELMYARKLGF